MIQIKKSSRGVCPVINNQQGNNKITLETNSNNALYDANPLDYDNRIRKFDFHSSIYGHSLIKNRLRESQKGKCAFCEGNVTSVSHGDIEHFRPKAYWVQKEVSLQEGPGYYWLAYDFDNLIFACQICNQRYKKNYFPIRRLEYRAKNHHQSNKLLKEKPFFVNPIEENPRNLIRFNKATAIGIDRNHRGKKTIKSLGLNRKGEKGISDLYELRLRHYELCDVTYWLSNQIASNDIPQDKIDEANTLMDNLRNYKSQYSAMVNDNFPA